MGRGSGTMPQVDFNPRAPCGARLLRELNYFSSLEISTHAPLAGRDCVCVALRIHKRDFNPRAPCGARRHSLLNQDKARQDFNPRAPCGARQKLRERGERQQNFNPRAPCGARPDAARRCPPQKEFQPTRPLRGATLSPVRERRKARISTHAPLAGRDGVSRQNRPRGLDFNPRAPCGARHSGRAS